ncbi:MAG: hypothetical protein KKH74_06320 [Gammaproteobacteria bacterium]|nr:hypothetical protein [Gammaproteobacteria bacterium]MBU1732258.1 hypothetical protein [Gammaproteobacteria bacterium]MBU1893828.1 hypothetical protein [Gammaproteobacteria bacterium]
MLKPANVLPLAAARLLQQAAQTPLDRNAPEPGFERRKAVDKAITYVKSKYPKFFNQETES